MYLPPHAIETLKASEAKAKQILNATGRGSVVTLPSTSHRAPLPEVISSLLELSAEQIAALDLRDVVHATVEDEQGLPIRDVLDVCRLAGPLLHSTGCQMIACESTAVVIRPHGGGAVMLSNSGHPFDGSFALSSPANNYHESFRSARHALWATIEEAQRASIAAISRHIEENIDELVGGAEGPSELVSALRTNLPAIASLIKIDHDAGEDDLPAVRIGDRFLLHFDADKRAWALAQEIVYPASHHEPESADLKFMVETPEDADSGDLAAILSDALEAHVRDCIYNTRMEEMHGFGEAFVSLRQVGAASAPSL